MGVKFILKRDGSKVQFERAKVERVFGLALGDSNGERIEWSNYEKLIDQVCESVEDGMTVEDVSDLLQRAMMKNGLFDTAEKFISYRGERSRERKTGKDSRMSKYFTNDFLSKYKHATEPFDPLGAFVYARTYSRWLPEKGRRERWFETVLRAVEFNLSLAKHTKEEAEQLFDNVFYLRQNLSGRMTWLGGTPTSHSNALGLFNCAFDIADSFDTFVEGFTVLMLGAGLGVRILQDDVNKIPAVRNNIDLINKSYDPVHQNKRKEYTSLIEHNKTMVEIVIGDSRGGWTEALDIYFNLLWNVKYKQVDTIVLNYDNIREKGRRIKGFGGKSSGHEPLMDMFTKIHKVLQQGSDTHYRLKTIDALDIINLIAMNVVSGNVRRSSVMVTCAPDDYAIINAKNDLYKQIDGQWILDKSIEHRQMSNNTVLYASKPTREQWAEHFKKQRFSGEPAFANLEQMLKRNPNAKGLNPCGS